MPGANAAILGKGGVITPFDIRTLILVNLIMQTSIMGVIFLAAYLARVKRKVTSHCTIMRITVPVQIATIASVMLPSLLGYLRAPSSLFTLELLAHHVLGVMVVVLWVYINLAFKGVVKMRFRLVLLMRLALGSWVATFALGWHIYSLVWL